MGRTTSLDGALQLLLIVDLICEWARDDFRFEISCCLAGGKDNLRRDNLRRDNLRDGSPAATYRSRFSTQEPQQEGTTNSLTHGGVCFSPIPESEMDFFDFGETASMTSLTLEDSMMEVDGMMESHPALLRDERIELYEDFVSHPLLKWARISPTDVAWTAHATIRHSNMCLFAFSHLSLPQDPESLVECLRQASSLGVGSARTIAMSLVVSLTDPSLVRNTTMERILQLKNDWLREGESASNVSEFPVSALFVFRTHIRTSDWQLVRELWCISCTAQTLHTLAKVAGFAINALRTRMQQSANEDPLPASDFEALRGLTGSDAASAAINSKVLYHCVASPGGKKSDFDCTWESRLASEDVKRSFSLLAPSVCFRGRTASRLDRGTALMEVLKKPSPKKLLDHLGPEIPARRGAILLRKGQHWAPTTPTWCLMILDELELEESEELERRIGAQEKYQEFDFAPSHDEAGKPIQKTVGYREDEEFLDTWMQDLRW